MKINKTEREFREAINRGRVGLRVPVDDTVPFADALKAALDLEFKAEEPELLGECRVFYNKTMNCLAVKTERGWRGLKEDEGMEAAARCNAVERFTRGHDRPIFQRLLDEERAKLAKEPS